MNISSKESLLHRLRLPIAFVCALGIHGWILFGWQKVSWEAPIAGSVDGNTAMEVELIASSPAEFALASPEKEEVSTVQEEIPEPVIDTPEVEPIPTPAPPLEEAMTEPDPIPEPTPAPAPPVLQNKTSPPKVYKKSSSSTSSPSKNSTVKSASASSSTGSGTGATGKPGNGVSTSKPSYLRNPHPTYPEDARHAGAEGVVTLRVLVGKTGRVVQAKVERSCGHASLDQRALETVRDRWVFRPARLHGQSVEAEVLIPIRFSLK